MWLKDTANNLSKDYKEPEKVRAMDIIHSPIFNHQVLEDNIRNIMININNLSINELYTFVQNNYNSIISIIFGNQTGKNNNEYLQMFVDIRFLGVMSRVLSNVQIDPVQRMNCCKIVFDYMSLPIERRDPEIFAAIQDFGRVVLRDTIPALESIGVDSYYAVYMTAAMNSSSNIKINIQRINYIIANSKEFTEQKIVDIYIHFGKYYNLTMSELLSSYMFSVDPINIDEEVSDMYSVISMSILDILSNMTLDEIKAVLIKYSTTFTTVYGGDYRIARFSLHALSADFSRISSMAYLLSSEGYPIP